MTNRETRHDDPRLIGLRLAAAAESPSAPLPEPTTEEANAQLRALLRELLEAEEKLCATIRAALSPAPEQDAGQ
jgi:hypothetical protein